MMGQRTFSPLPDDLSLENLVLSDHFYRRLEARLDLSFVRELVAPLYAGGGGPSVDPVVFFKLQLVMFFEDLRSECQLMRVVTDRLSLRWYLGYDLFESLPDHSSLTRIRERFGLEVFRRFFERIVAECVEAGLVWGEELFFDATKVETNASIDSTRSRALVEEHLAGVFPHEPSPERDDGHSEVVSGSVGPAGDESRALARENALRHRWVEKAGRQERDSVRWGYTRVADPRVSTTDADASPMCQKNNRSGKLGYLTHYAVDGGEARVVLNVLVTEAEVAENLPMQQMLFRSTFRWGLRPRSVKGDAAYDTRENITAIERAGIRAYTALPQQGKRTSLFTVEDFLYDAERDLYTCPAGQVLRRQGNDRRGGYVRYAVRTSACVRCPPEEQVHEQPEGPMAKPRSRRAVLGQGQSVPPDRGLPQGFAQTGPVGETFVRGGQGVARIDEVQAEGAREGELVGAHDRFRAEREAAFGPRPQRTEEDRDGGGPAPTREAISAPALPTPHHPSTAFFNRLGCSGKSRDLAPTTPEIHEGCGIRLSGSKH